MRVSVIANGETLGSRIREALVTAGHECPAGHVVRVNEAESHIVRCKPNAVVASTDEEIEAAVALISRLRDLTPGYLLAVGQVTDPRQVLRILRGGAADYIDQSEIEAELGAALTRLRFGRVERADPGRFLVVLSPSGGSGASMVAVNLAVAMAKTQERSLLIDLKSNSGDLAAMLDLKPSHTMYDLCRVAERIDRVLFEQTLSKHDSGVSLLASPRTFDARFTTDALTRVVELGRALFPRMIADIDPSLPSEAIEAARLADMILLVIRLEFNSLRNAKSMMEHLERRGINPKRIALIGNRCGQSKEIPAAKIEEALGRKFFAKLPDDPKPALGSQNNGVPVLKEYPSSYLSKALLVLTKDLEAIPTPAASVRMGHLV